MIKLPDACGDMQLHGATPDTWRFKVGVSHSCMHYLSIDTEEIDPNNVTNTDEPFARVDGDTVKLMYFNGQNANTVFPGQSGLN